MKDELGIKEYIRYMDDFIVLVNSKTEAIELMNKVTIFLKEKLNLKLNKKTNYFKAKQGVAFVRISYICK